MATPVQTHHIFVDFENVHEVDLAVIGHDAVTFTLLVGPQKKKLDADLVEKLLENAACVNLVRLAASGRNALDFALAYYLGRATSADPRGWFHLISKDTGYDPLLVHLNANNFRADRHVDFTTLPFVAPSKKKSPPPAKPRAKPSKAKEKSPPPAKAAPKAPAKPAARPEPAVPHPQDPPGANLTVMAVERLIRNEPNNPKTLVRLRSYLRGQLGAKVSDQEAEHIIRDLEDNDVIRVDEKGKVSYDLEPFMEDEPTG